MASLQSGSKHHLQVLCITLPIMLDELDKELESRGHKFCRYADDCNIYVKSYQAGTRVLESMTNFGSVIIDA